MVGRVFDYLTVLSVGDRSEGYKCDCVCKCGNRSRAIKFDLLNGRTRSCGCLGKKLWKDQSRIENHQIKNFTKNSKKIRGVRFDLPHPFEVKENK